MQLRVVTIGERRAGDLARLAAAAASVTVGLADYARRTGVRFVIFGSFARGDFVPSSDIDIMIEGSSEHLRAARDFTEDLCGRNGLRHDVHLGPEVSEPLMIRIRRDGRRIP